jgi:hypothetical protein
MLEVRDGKETSSDGVGCLHDKHCVEYVALYNV